MIADEALAEIIDSYTREAGVRNLEREIANVFRAIAVEVAEGKAQPTETVDRRRIGEHARARRSTLARSPSARPSPGVATGLAWTPVGGDILFIEATKMPGKGQLVLTGQLGDVMKESAQAALSYVRAHAPLARASTDELPREEGHPHPRPRRAPSPRTARRRASPCSPRWRRCSPASRSAATWR